MGVKRVGFLAALAMMLTPSTAWAVRGRAGIVHAFSSLAV